MARTYFRWTWIDRDGKNPPIIEKGFTLRSLESFTKDDKYYLKSGYIVATYFVEIDWFCIRKAGEKKASRNNKLSGSDIYTIR